MEGATINGRYTLGKLLGQGGMGAVYVARDAETGRRVALKLIRAEHVDAATRGRFQREVKVAAALESQHITQVFDAGTDAATSSPFMVMEYLDGEDLAHLAARLGPLPAALATRIIAQACLGMKKAHEAGIVHRDMKPGNLFLAKRDGEIVVKVLDFGIAKGDAFAGPQDLTRAGSVIGTPLYMAPEQARHKAADARSDVWSLGVVLYRALTGRAPNEHLSSYAAVIAALVMERPRPVRELAPWVPEDVAEVVGRALQHDPEKRYEHAGAMLDALRGLLPDGDLRIDEAMLVTLTDVERTSLAPRLSETLLAAKGRKSIEVVTPVLEPAPPPASRGMGGPMMLGVALLIGVGAFALYRARTPPPRPAPAVTATVAAAPPPPPPPIVASVTAAPVDLTRKVQLVIVPSDAAVEIDGAKAPARDGIVVVAGTLGSVHRVRVFKGKAEVVGDVAITDTGALPPKLEIGKVPVKPVVPPPAATPDPRKPMPAPPPVSDLPRPEPIAPAAPTPIEPPPEDKPASAPAPAPEKPPSAEKPAKEVEIRVE